MAYLEEIRNQLSVRNYTKAIALWEEFCLCEDIESDELSAILSAIKQSEIAKQFAARSEEIIPLVLNFKTFKEQVTPLSLIYDLQNSNSQNLQDIAIDFLQTHFGTSPLFNEKLKLVGLRGAPLFQGAISNFILLDHLKKNNFVLHTAGWGVGEIIDVSFVREQATIEFEHLSGGKKDISFNNAFKTLLPIGKNHFLARRFSDADNFEKEARTNPAQVIRCLLESLGPRSASEIKDDITDFVIPEADYSNWWQKARPKLKKDPLLDIPSSVKEPFRLRKGGASWNERIEKAFYNKLDFNQILASANSLIRDFPELLKDENAKAQVVEKIQSLIKKQHVSDAEHIQVLLFMEHSLEITVDQKELKKALLELEHVEEVLAHIAILSLKKRFLSELKSGRIDWPKVFLKVMLSSESNQLKDFLLKELSSNGHEEEVKVAIQHLLKHPKEHPESLVWYFSKIHDRDAPYFTSEQDRSIFFEAFLILLSSVEQKPEYKDLTRKMYIMLTEKRYSLIRSFLKGTNITFAKEFLLLASKCHTLADHEQKIFRSLVEVEHPSLAKEKKEDDIDLTILWTTETGYKKAQERIKHIGTVEIIDVAKEIEAARALGDLRENSEYKFAQERRARLQSELKELSDQFNKARIITSEDISLDRVGIGTKVGVKNSQNEITYYVILGPWDADADNNILSYQSKFAQAMFGKIKNDLFSFRSDEFTIISLASYLS